MSAAFQVKSRSFVEASRRGCMVEVIVQPPIQGILNRVSTMHYLRQLLRHRDIGPNVIASELTGGDQTKINLNRVHEDCPRRSQISHGKDLEKLSGTLVVQAMAKAGLSAVAANK